MMAEGLRPSAEFCRFVDQVRIGRSVVAHTIEADEGEREALASRLGLLSLDELYAEIGLSCTSGGLVRLKARFKARYLQSCVVTLQPVHRELDEEFELFFREDATLSGTGALESMIGDEVWPEPLNQGRVDMGEAVSQQLALALDPYPRAPGAVFEATAERFIDAQQANPLAEVGKLKPFGRQKDIS